MYKCCICNTECSPDREAGKISVIRDDKHYCLPCSEVLDFADLIDEEKIIKKVKTCQQTTKENKKKKSSSHFMCPSCKNQMDKICNKCKFKNPLYR